MAKILVRMVDLQGRTVSSKEMQISDVTDSGIKIVEDAQNEVLRQIGFKGYCKVDRI